MSNLILASLLLVSTGVLCVTRHWRHANLAAENRRWAGELSAAQASLTAAAGNLASLRRRQDARRAELQVAERDATVAREELDGQLRELTRDKEGAWPKSKSYFYLRKQALAVIGYRPITEDGHLDPVAARLFGLTSGEQRQVDDLYQAFGDGIRKLQLERAERQPVDPAKDTPDRREVVYKIPVLAPEVAGLRQNFEQSLAGTLGEERAGLLLERVRDWLREESDHAENEVRLLSLEAERDEKGRVEHYLREAIPANGSFTRMSVKFPPEPATALWPYRHLFGTEPLLPIPPGQQ